MHPLSQRSWGNIYIYMYKYIYIYVQVYIYIIPWLSDYLHFYHPSTSNIQRVLPLISQLKLADNKNTWAKLGAPWKLFCLMVIMLPILCNALKRWCFHCTYSATGSPCFSVAQRIWPRHGKAVAWPWLGRFGSMWEANHRRFLTGLAVYHMINEQKYHTIWLFNIAMV